MFIEYMVNLYNGILLSYEKRGHHKFCPQIDGTRKYHAKWDKSDPTRHSCYVLSN